MKEVNCNNLNRKVRNSNIELLRIISMLLIIVYHAMRMGYNEPTQQSNVYAGGVLLGSWGILGVYIFVAISSWFLVEQKFSIKRIISILLKDFIYLCIFSCAGIVVEYSYTSSIGSALNRFFLFWYEGINADFHWFVIAYVMLCVTVPFINIVLEKVTKAWHARALVVFTLIVLWSQFNGIIGRFGYFVYVYLLTSYVKRYCLGDRKMLKKAWFCVTGCFALFVLFMVLDNKLKSPVWYAVHLISRIVANKSNGSLVFIFISVSVLFIVAHLKPRSSKFINWVSGSTFGVYLFHETFFCSMIRNGETIESCSLIDVVMVMAERIGIMQLDVWFSVRLIAIVVCVFFAGILFDKVESFLIEKQLLKVLNKYNDKLESVNNWFALKSKSENE